MASMTITKTITSQGVTIPSNKTVTAEGGINQVVALAAGLTATLTTRTSDLVGVVTLASGHGLTTSSIIDIYWTGGERVGCTITAQDATTVTTATGSGDVLPAQDTVLIVGVHTAVECTFDADLMSSVAFGADQKVSSHFTDNSDDSLALSVTTNANESYDWEEDNGITNPLDGVTVKDMQISNGTLTVATYKALFILDTVS